MATHSSNPAWKIAWRVEPGRLQSMGSAESDTNEKLSMRMSKGNCLSKRRDSHLNLGQLRRVL